jgi:hypothetical protein
MSQGMDGPAVVVGVDELGGGHLGVDGRHQLPVILRALQLACFHDLDCSWAAIAATSMLMSAGIFGALACCSSVIGAFCPSNPWPGTTSSTQTHTTTT